MPVTPTLEGWRREDPLGLLASSLATLQVQRGIVTQWNKHTIKGRRHKDLFWFMCLRPGIGEPTHAVHAPPHIFTQTHTNKNKLLQQNREY